jgi:hypothetical protein
LDEFFGDAAVFHTPQSHLMAPPVTLRIPIHFDPAFDPKRTEFLSRMVEQWGRFEGGANQRRWGPPLRIYRSERPAHDADPPTGKHRSGGSRDEGNRRNRLVHGI